MRSVRIFYFLVVVILAVATTASHAQTVIPKKPIDETLISNLSTSERDRFYSDRRAAKRKSVPRIVFVPGILGSKIEECRADGSQCANIWGTADAIRRSNIDLSVRSDRKYRTDVVESIFFRDIYGGLLDYIRAQADAVAIDSAEDALVSVVHYDWRVSNGDNAKLLKDRVCDIRARAEESPIVIIAHSMGGILTKVWAARHAREQCANGRNPRVTQIVFVATPHLGSPKAIKAIAEGYNIIFDELTGLKKYLGWFERNYLLDAINQAGISFPSLYELLPIRGSEYCSQLKPAIAKALVPAVGDNDQPISLFEAEVWSRYDLLRRIGSAPVRRSYYQNDLAPLLRRAERLLCEIADFDPATIADVLYIFGREKADRTLGWFQLRSGLPNVINSSTAGQGDGTVPVYSAQNFLVSSTWQTKEVQADHTSIVSNIVLLAYVKDLYSKAIQRAELQNARSNGQYASLLTTEMAATGNLLFVDSNPATWTGQDEKLAIELNSSALKLMDYQPTDVAQFASYTLSPSERKNLYTIAASSTSVPSLRLTWIAESARSSYEAGRYQDAIVNAAYIAASTPFVSPTDPNLAILQKSAKEIEGWSYLKAGDLTKFNELASAYATQYSVSKDNFKEPIAPSADLSSLIASWPTRHPNERIYMGGAGLPVTTGRIGLSIP